MRYAFHLMLSSSCLVRNLEPMFNLYNLVLREPNFRFHDRLESILSDTALSESQTLVDSGHKLLQHFFSDDLKDLNNV